MRFLQTSETTEKSCALIEAVYEQGAHFPLHVHTKENEVFYVIKGNIAFTLDRQIINVTKGNSIFLPKNIKHGFTIISKIAKVLIIIEPAGLENYFKIIGMHNSSHPNLEKPMVEIETILKNFGVTILGDENIN